ncbi:MAG: hypothetical protein H6667_08355 [Ardenticatenaceae bacterium]|nr:hypothetical protein [Ardenticatenaceae bacterium]
MRNKIVWLGLGIIAVLCIALFVTNFHLANSETQTNATTVSSRWPSEASVPPQTVPYRIEGDGPLAVALREALSQKLMNAQPAADTAVPQLIVRIDQANINWTPVHGRAEIMTTAAFSSNGDFAFMAAEPTYFQFNDDDDAGAGFIVQAASEISLTDKSTGLLSHPGYHQLLADKLAEEINKALQTNIFAAP